MGATHQIDEVVVSDSNILDLIQQEFIQSKMLASGKMTHLKLVAALKSIMSYCKDDNEYDIRINNGLKWFTSFFDLCLKHSLSNIVNVFNNKHLLSMMLKHKDKKVLSGKGYSTLVFSLGNQNFTMTKMLINYGCIGDVKFRIPGKSQCRCDNSSQNSENEKIVNNVHQSKQHETLLMHHHTKYINMNLVIRIWQYV